jgi:hypothetical protein
MEVSTKGKLQKAKSMEKENVLTSMEAFMKGNGIWVRNTDLVLKPTVMDLNLKENGKMISDMERENLHLLMEHKFPQFGNMVSRMEKGSSFKEEREQLKFNSSKTCSWNLIIKILICMTEHTLI